MANVVPHLLVIPEFVVHGLEIHGLLYDFLVGGKLFSVDGHDEWPGVVVLL